jgi:hypothetical protein
LKDKPIRFFELINYQPRIGRETKMGELCSITNKKSTKWQKMQIYKRTKEKNIHKKYILEQKVSIQYPYTKNTYRRHSSTHFILH